MPFIPLPLSVRFALPQLFLQTEPCASKSSHRARILMYCSAETFCLEPHHQTVCCQQPVPLCVSLRPLPCYLPTSLQSEKIFSTRFKAGFSFLCPTFPCQSPCETGRATDSGRGMFGRGMGCGFAALSLRVYPVPIRLHGFGLEKPVGLAAPVLRTVKHPHHFNHPADAVEHDPRIKWRG